jgi:5'(3')-deoxyribonucleotidase
VARLRLGIDLDGVVSDFNAGWTRRYNHEFGTGLRPEEIATWRAPASLTHFGSMSRFWRWARTCADGNSLFSELEPYPGALDALNRLARRNRVVILTTKPSYAVHDTLAWLAEQRVPTTEVHITEDKASVPCDVYLDDADHNLERLVAARPESVVCRFVRAWNRPATGAVDVTSWAEFEAVVARVAADLA